MKRRRRLSGTTIQYLEGLLFISPWLIGFMVFMAFPLGYSLYMSFHNVEILATGIKTSFEGWNHYKFILFTSGGILYNDLIPFLIQSLMMLPVIIVFSLMIAIVLNQRFAGRGFFRGVFFLPVIFASGQLVQEFLSQGEGKLNFLDQYNISGIIAENLPKTLATPIVAIMDSFVLVLWYSGVQILIFLAGRQTISGSVYEAARIDGANPWEVFWKITLPAMTPFIMLNLIYTVVDLFTFPTNPILTKVNTSNYGQSSALAWIYFTIIFILLGLIFLVFKRVTSSRKTSA